MSKKRRVSTVVTAAVAMVSDERTSYIRVWVILLHSLQRHLHIWMIHFLSTVPFSPSQLFRLWKETESVALEGRKEEEKRVVQTIANAALTQDKKRRCIFSCRRHLSHASFQTGVCSVVDCFFLLGRPFSFLGSSRPLPSHSFTQD